LNLTWILSGRVAARWPFQNAALSLGDGGTSTPVGLKTWSPSLVGGGVGGQSVGDTDRRAGGAADADAGCAGWGVGVAALR